jgi:hypothetical protein
MSLFEGSALGLASFVLLAGTALTGAVRAMARGDQMAAVRQRWWPSCALVSSIISSKCRV